MAWPPPSRASSAMSAPLEQKGRGELITELMQLRQENRRLLDRTAEVDSLRARLAEVKQLVTTARAKEVWRWTSEVELLLEAVDKLLGIP